MSEKRYWNSQYSRTAIQRYPSEDDHLNEIFQMTKRNEAMRKPWEQIEQEWDAQQLRRQRSLQTCWRYRSQSKAPYSMPKTQGYTPEISERVDKDRNLNSSARDTLRFIVRDAYRKARDTRILRITVSFIAHGRAMSTRAIQYHLRVLQKAGYIGAHILKNSVTGMIEGLEIELLEPIFPEHHREKWPQSIRKSGAQFISEKKRSLLYITESIQEWASRCMLGVYRSYLRTTPLFHHAAAFG